MSRRIKKNTQKKKTQKKKNKNNNNKIDNTIETNKIIIDYKKIKKAISEALSEIYPPKKEEGKRKKICNIISAFLFRIVLPISAFVIAYLGYINNSNNSSLIYNYETEIIKGTSELKDAMKFVVSEKDEYFTRIPIDITLQLDSGTIKSIYLVYEDYDENLTYDKLNLNILKKEMFNLSPSTEIKVEIDHRSETEIHNTPLWIVIIDNKNNITIDFYEAVAKSIIMVKNQRVSVDASYKNQDIILNYRSIKYDSLFESDFLDKAKWHDSKNHTVSDISEKYIIEKVNMIRKKFENIYK